MESYFKSSRVCVDEPVGFLSECPYSVLGSEVRLVVAYVDGNVMAYSYNLYSFSRLKNALCQRLCSDSSIRSVDVLTYREDCVLSVYRS